MVGAELTPVQRFVLVTLMIKGGTLPNTYFANIARISLKREYRDGLRDRGLINVTAKPLVLELTEQGWGQAINELGAEVPARAGSAGGALYIALEFLRGLLDHLKVAPSELFTLRFSTSDATAPSGPPPADFEASIRKAYGQVARAGDYVSLAEIKNALTTDIDATLIQMYDEPGVNLIPNSQQGDLTDEDRAAAVKIGNQDRHLIAIKS
jgi:hypothetical protein